MWGCTVQPLCSEQAVSIPYEGSAVVSDIARCKSCGGYINPHAMLKPTSWVCPLCYQGILSIFIYKYSILMLV